MLKTNGSPITTSGVNIYGGDTNTGGIICTIPSDSTQTRLCRAYVTVTLVSTAGGTYKLSLLAGSTYIAGSPSDLDLSTSLATNVYKFWTDDIIIPAGETFTIRLKSPNITDTSVSATTQVYYSMPTMLPITATSDVKVGVTDITLEEMIVQLWNRFYGKVVLDKVNNDLTTYQVLSPTTEATFQTITIADNVETVGLATTPS